MALPLRGYTVHRIAEAFHVMAGIILKNFSVGVVACMISKSLRRRGNVPFEGRVWITRTAASKRCSKPLPSTSSSFITDFLEKPRLTIPVIFQTYKVVRVSMKLTEEKGRK